MSRINRLYEIAKQENRLVLNIFLTVGYPDLLASEELARIALESGAEVIELGVPFSDPMAEGMTIQESSQVAIDNGITLDDCIGLASRLRADYEQAGILLMGYVNPFIAYGLNNLGNQVRDADIDGLVVADLPPEEAMEFQNVMRKADAILVQFLAPTTDPNRAKIVVESGEGFIYCVSLTGVTGERDQLDAGVVDFLIETKKLTDRPLVVGFGISSTKHVTALRGSADGVVVGSAFVRVCGMTDVSARNMQASQLVRDLSAAARGMDNIV